MAAGAMLWVVAAALVDDAGRVLVQRRPAGKSLAGLWEFPGGKIEPGETPEAALVRELHEELGIGVQACDLSAGTFVSATLGDRHLVMLLYSCRRWQGRPQAIHADALAWHDATTLGTLAMPSADAPLVAWLRNAPLADGGDRFGRPAGQEQQRDRLDQPPVVAEPFGKT